MRFFNTISGRTWAALFAAALACACGGSPTSPTSTPTPVVTPSPPTTPTPVPPTPVPTAPTLAVARILCFGDSMTEGFLSVTPTWLLAATPESYPSRLQILLSARYTSQQLVVTNAGRSGEWAVDGQTRIVSVLQSVRPDAVVLMEGINDLTAMRDAGIDMALTALENMLRDARAAGAKVMLASLPPERRGGTLAGAIDLVPQFNVGVRRLAERQGVLFVDVNAAFGGDLSLIGADGLHPNAAGYQRIADTVFAVLQANFEQAPKTKRTPGT